MKITSKKESKGFSPLTISMTFETPEELYVFELRMSGWLSGMSYNTLIGRVEVCPTYSGQAINHINNACYLQDDDIKMARAVNDIIREHNKESK